MSLRPENKIGIALLEAVQTGLTVVSIATDTDTDILDLPTCLVWSALRRGAKVSLVQHSRDETLESARKRGLDLAPYLENQIHSGDMQGVLYLRTFFPPNWDQPDEDYRRLSGSRYDTAKTFAERCFGDWGCTLLVIDDSRKVPGVSLQILVGLHEFGKGREVCIIHFRSSRSRSGYSARSLAHDPRAALYKRVAEALPSDVGVIAALPDRSGAILLYPDAAARGHARYDLKANPVPSPSISPSVAVPAAATADTFPSLAETNQDSVEPAMIDSIERKVILALLVLAVAVGVLLAKGGW